MSQYLPTVAWSTLAGNVRLGLTSYRYLVDVNYFDLSFTNNAYSYVIVDYNSKTHTIK